MRTIPRRIYELSLDDLEIIKRCMEEMDYKWLENFTRNESKTYYDLLFFIREEIETLQEE